MLSLKKCEADRRLKINPLFAVELGVLIIEKISKMQGFEKRKSVWRY
ncbi:hypothetical protein UMN179_01232 [Gallibacterium anatis UMN179]|uniref:Uncharacterized protein n=1 Tax=Gallibacterium anatis (strain UMN179) TaxID=1005058 RepID=F4H9U5_GALAU|nr:hypothetical protein UMN179_01232 [Gallibacterium anatis UMN179]